MNASKALPTTVQMNLRAIERLGWSARVVDEQYGHLIEMSNGSDSVNLVGGVSPVNNATAYLLAQDKYYSYLVLNQHNIRCPHSVRCLRAGDHRFRDIAHTPGVKPGLQFARERGYPLVVKPNRGVRGQYVCEVTDDDSLVKAVEMIWREDYFALVQERIERPEIRLDFLDGEFLVGYERRPVEIRGDGERTIRALIAELDVRYASDERWQWLVKDELWTSVTQSQGYTPDTILPQDTSLRIGGTILNLNRWSLATFIRFIPEAWREHCRNIGAALGLRHMGIDFRGASLDDPPDSAVVLEVNASPLVIQLAQLGYEEEAVAAQMRVLRACFE